MNKNKNEPKISVAEARKALGMVTKNYSDEDVLEILHLLKEAAEYTYEEYVAQEVPNKNR